MKLSPASTAINVKLCVYFSAGSIEFNVRCATIKLALPPKANLLERFNFKLLELQCDLGININPQLFLLISYAIIGLSASIILKKVFRIIWADYINYSNVKFALLRKVIAVKLHWIKPNFVVKTKTLEKYFCITWIHSESSNFFAQNNSLIASVSVFFFFFRNWHHV